MLGVLTKTNNNWVVNHSYSLTKDDWETLPLHPDDVKQINRDAQVFDNIEARIAAYPDVEFEIARYCKKHNSDPSKNSVCTLDCGYEEVSYAKLVNN